MPTIQITVLGATGSIGLQTLDIVGQSDRFAIFALTCHRNIEEMVTLVERYKPRYAVISEPAEYPALKSALAHTSTEVLSGAAGMEWVSTHPDVDCVVAAVVGSAGILPTFSAVRAGKRIALANKETLVAAGAQVMSAARRYGATLLPVDSEHSAIFQCLRGEDPASVSELILTASGGAFRDFTREEIVSKSAVHALKHPNWAMGKKITIDSATLMNKGLEIIEASWLFGVSERDISVVIHPQSIIHSMVRYADGSVMAQMGRPDMRLPIIHALDYPNRRPNDLEPLDFMALGALTFQKPDLNRFPCLELARSALRMGGAVPAAMNAANEVLVAAYLRDAVTFYDIPEAIEYVMHLYKGFEAPSLETILEADRTARDEARQWIAKHR